MPAWVVDLPRFVKVSFGITPSVKRTYAQGAGRRLEVAWTGQTNDGSVHVLRTDWHRSIDNTDLLACHAVIHDRWQMSGTT